METSIYQVLCVYDGSAAAADFNLYIKWCYSMHVKMISTVSSWLLIQQYMWQQ